MERFLGWVREHPQFAGLSFGFLVLVLVLTVLATAMSRAGVSLRPLIWFAGFFAIVAGPQAVVHLLDGFVLNARRASIVAPQTSTTQSSPSESFAPVPWAVVFGPKADPDLITDAKRGLGAILEAAEEAKLSFNVDGESALAARFSSAAGATRAVDLYGSFFAFTGAQGSDATGWTARRHGGQGEWVHVVAAGPELYAWTSASRERVLENRMRALGPLAEGEPVLAAAHNAAGPQLVSDRLRSKTGLMVAIVCLNLVAAVGWFFKGSAWSARIDGAKDVRPESVYSLRDAILASDQSEGPVDVSVRSDGALQVDWRYADARWFDAMQAHRMKRTQRLVLQLDERTHTVRVREYLSAFDGSVGANSLRLNWKLRTGIMFFEYEKQRVVGVQLGSDGRPTGELSKAYTFDSHAMKRPLIHRVTKAGWRWQPLTWNAPEALRWLTE